MFLSFNNNEAETAKYIKSVTYNLHPTFKPSVIKVTEPPFLLSRVGWGYFEITMNVEFQPATKIGVKNLNHMLEFEGAGRTQSFLLEVNADDGDQGVARLLASKMDKLSLGE